MLLVSLVGRFSVLATAIPAAAYDMPRMAMHGCVRISFRAGLDGLHLGGKVERDQRAAQTVEECTDEGFFRFHEPCLLRNRSPQDALVPLCEGRCIDQAGQLLGQPVVLKNRVGKNAGRCGLRRGQLADMANRRRHRREIAAFSQRGENALNDWWGHGGRLMEARAWPPVNETAGRVGVLRSALRRKQRGDMTVRSNVWVTVTIGIAAALGLVASGQTARERLKDPSQLNERAPDVFRARFDTSQGVFVISVEREWAPLAADRFYNLAKNGFYDDSRFFRVLDGFMAQFGLHADPAVQSAWTSANLRDEPVLKSNARGFVSFTRESGPNSRYTMIFINYKDNSYLDADGFAPFGQVVNGMDVVDKLYSGYGRQNVPDQRRIVREGNAYLLEQYPKLDFIKASTIELAVQGASRSTQVDAARRARIN